MYSTHTHSLHTHILYTSSTLRSHHPYTGTSTPKKHCFTFISLALGNPSRSPRTRSTRSNRSNRIESTRSNRIDPIEPTRPDRIDPIDPIAPRSTAHRDRHRRRHHDVCDFLDHLFVRGRARARGDQAAIDETVRAIRRDATRRDSTRVVASRRDSIESNRIDRPRSIVSYLDRRRGRRGRRTRGDARDARGARGMRAGDAWVGAVRGATRGRVDARTERAHSFMREGGGGYRRRRARDDDAEGGRGTRGAGRES